MYFPPTFPATGALIGWKDRVFAIDAIKANSGVEVSPADRTGWWKVNLRSKTPLLQTFDASTFTYFLLLREGKEGALVLAPDLDLIHPFLQRVGLANDAFSPTIAVDRLVRKLFSEPGAYAAGVLYARTFGSGRSLRSLSLYGDDLAQADLVRSIIGSIYPFRVHLRKVTLSHEVLGISSQGEVNFLYRGTESLEEADLALGYISSAGFIDWSKRLAVLPSRERY